MQPLTLLLTVLTFPNLIACWGNLGHRTVAYLAQKHLTPLGTSYIHNLLGDQDISDAAIWPDEYKKTPEGKHTFTWHFINVHDDPPRYCGVELERDCPGEKGFCIVTAIAEMIAQLTSPLIPNPPPEALKFLLHLLGDLHEPLHMENLAEGGNNIAVLFNNKATDLHSSWDYEMLLHYTNSTESNKIETTKRLADILYQRDKMESDGSKVSLGELEEAVGGLEKLVLSWARESNAWICEFVLRDGVEGVQGKELGGYYYKWAVPIMEQQIVKAGWRLGALINAVAELQENRDLEGDWVLRAEL